MNERDHVDPKALAVLNAALESDPNGRDWDDWFADLSLAWRAAGRPLLAPRTKAILEAVDAQMIECRVCREGMTDENPESNWCSTCEFYGVRRAAKGES